MVRSSAIHCQLGQVVTDARHPHETMPLPTSQRQHPHRVLSRFDCVCIIVGTIIGSGIFKTAPIVASNAGGWVWMTVLWVGGGLLSLVGAICFAELTTRYRNEVGGDFIYLKKAFGSPLAFMFAWAAFWIVRPGNIGAMAMTFATYFNQIVPVGYFGVPDNNLVPYAALSVVVLSLANLVGLRAGKRIQNVLTVAKVIGIGGIIGVALVFDNATAGPVMGASTQPGWGALWLAMVLVMFTFGGWNDIAFVAGEVKNPESNLLQSLVIGILVVTLIYLLANWAFVFGLGYERMANSSAVATDMVSATLGESTWVGQRSSQLIGALVCVSCLGAINGMIITSPRIYFAAGKEYPAFSFLSQWNERRDVPWQAVLIQALITTGLMLICLEYQNAFEVIVNVIGPYFWGFLGLVAVSLIVLRFKDPVADGFRVPLFPLEPLVLLLVCGALVYASTSWVIQQEYWFASGVVAGLMIVGVILGMTLRRVDN